MVDDSTAQRMKHALVGGLAAIVLAPAAAAVTATVYRFPVPMVGYTSGFGGALTAAVGSVFYLVLGGALVLGALGAVGGYVAVGPKRPAGAGTYALAVLIGLGVAVAGAVALALLEYVIGPW
ncbi:hypothetical protein ACFO5K_06270 [Nocardia halotolerans]|uniref:DUF4190 domain-containing protein n=1 Tax=Nocardia halotolerans TaxID=1755878 RepID=A0ABV8VDJ9_9NOCA